MAEKTEMRERDSDERERQREREKERKLDRLDSKECPR